MIGMRTQSTHPRNKLLTAHAQAQYKCAEDPHLSMSVTIMQIRAAPAWVTGYDMHMAPATRQAERVTALSNASLALHIVALSHIHLLVVRCVELGIDHVAMLSLVEPSMPIGLGTAVPAS